MSYIPKRKWPLRLVAGRRQDFRSTDDHPDGFIEERLECGHVYINDIATSSPEHRTQARRRRCRECAKESLMTKHQPHRTNVEHRGDKWVAVCSTCRYEGRPMSDKSSADKDADDHAIAMARAEP